jgi:hypothetical protein
LDRRDATVRIARRIDRRTRSARPQPESLAARLAHAFA